MKESNRVAVFIDGENMTAKVADRLMEEASNYGDVIVKRVFADWSSPNVQAWKEVISRHSLIAEQQFSAVKGKNSSDMALIINVMSVLFEKDIDVFCLASSDSDFTRLVQELRERQKKVVGFGLKQTAQAFVNAFSEFIYLDSEKEKSEKQAPVADKFSVVLDESRRLALKEIIDKLIEDDGRALYARIANEMKNKYADFVPKNYNCRSLKDLIGKVIDSIGNYEIQTDSDGTTMFLIPKKVPRASEKPIAENKPKKVKPTKNENAKPKKKNYNQKQNKGSNKRAKGHKTNDKKETSAQQ